MQESQIAARFFASQPYFMKRSLLFAALAFAEFNH
jgi:hypothetical protein